ncbi:unnamed protein product, partial [Amoebophrya sp. A120]
KKEKQFFDQCVEQVFRPLFQQYKNLGKTIVRFAKCSEPHRCPLSRTNSRDIVTRFPYQGGTNPDTRIRQEDFLGHHYKFSANSKWTRAFAIPTAHLEGNNPLRSRNFPRYSRWWQGRWMRGMAGGPDDDEV